MLPPKLTPNTGLRPLLVAGVSPRGWSGHLNLMKPAHPLVLEQSGPQHPGGSGKNQFQKLHEVNGRDIAIELETSQDLPSISAGMTTDRIVVFSLKS